MSYSQFAPQHGLTTGVTAGIDSPWRILTRRHESTPSNYLSQPYKTSIMQSLLTSLRYFTSTYVSFFGLVTKELGVLALTNTQLTLQLGVRRFQKRSLLTYHPLRSQSHHRGQLRYKEIAPFIESIPYTSNKYIIRTCSEVAVKASTSTGLQSLD